VRAVVLSIRRKQTSSDKLAESNGALEAANKGTEYDKEIDKEHAFLFYAIGKESGRPYRGLGENQIPFRASAQGSSCTEAGCILPSSTRHEF
jgi:hypothetical protein